MILLSVVLLILYQRYPIVFRSTINSLASLMRLRTASDTSINWECLQQGIEICTISVKNRETNLVTDVIMIRFDPRLIQTRILYNKNLITAKTIVESTGAIAAINASFFDPAGRPLGLLIQNGEVIQRAPRTGMFNSGIFCIKSNHPIIYHRSLLREAGITEAIQAMPRLIHNGKRTQDIKNKNERKRRSGIAIDYNGKIIIYATDTHLGGLSLAEIQNLLLRHELKIRSALNLDGGRSSQLYFKYNKTIRHIIGLVDVPVFLGFFTN